MRAELINTTQVAEILGMHPKSFRRWLATDAAARFRRVVKERERNKWRLREIERWLDGAEY